LNSADNNDARVTGHPEQVMKFTTCKV